ncbi:MAG: Lrp/AsnC family transcriptional regulator [Chloroflexi bacterium]|nr:Lrp/AsnC family transcriptional regulator [Chloroflexota bacterium]
MPVQLDDLDRKIIVELQRDGRASHAQMARELEVSEGTIRRRLGRLLQEEIIRVVAVAEPTKLGYHTSALVGLQVDPSQVEAAAGQLAQLAEAEYVAITTGSYDLFIWVHVASAAELAVLLHTKVGVIPGVRHTETFVNLETRKRVAGPLLAPP